MGGILVWAVCASGTASGAVLSGTIRNPGGTALSGDNIVRASGGISTNATSGSYAIAVSNGWSGVVVVERPNEGGLGLYACFAPNYRAYTNVTSDLGGQDFRILGTTGPNNRYQTISGWATNSVGQGVADALVAATTNGGAALTYSNGAYYLGYYYPNGGNWSGTVTPQRAETTFTPATRAYVAVSSGQSNQNYLASGGDGGESGGGMASDYEPAIGSATNSPIQNYRLLLATSTNGVVWTRTGQVLADQSSVADALVLPSGRLLAYFVAGGQRVAGATETINEIKLAVSDDQGATWLYRDVSFLPDLAGATKPVDPNAVLATNGDVRLLVTIDPDQDGTNRPCSYAAVSTNGGAAFALFTNAPAFQIAGTDLLDPENFEFGPGVWRIWTGGVPGRNLAGLSTDGGYSFANEGEFCSAVNPDDTNKCLIVSDVLADGAAGWLMYAFSDLATGKNIRRLASADAGAWTLDGDFEFHVDTNASAVESTDVWAPSVVSFADGTYLMIYETRIPTNASAGIASIAVASSVSALVTGQTARFTALATAADGTKRDVTMLGSWTSTNAAAASVDSSGTVAALSVGTTGLRLAYGGVTSAPAALVVRSHEPLPAVATNKIAFMSDRDGNYEIYLADLDGADPVNLTESATDEVNPHFRPDGAKILYDSLRAGTNRIYVAAADGSGETCLTADLAEQAQRGRWSWDGSNVCFQVGATGAGDIYLANGSGTAFTPVLTTTNDDEWPAFTPDNEWIVFQRTLATAPTPYSRLCKVRTNGTDLTYLTDGSTLDEMPYCSPDGAYVVFKRGVGTTDIYRIDADGTGLTNLTATADAIEDAPTYSWENDKIAYQLAAGGATTAEIVWQSATATNRIQITTNSSRDWNPTFAPAGLWLTATAGLHGAISPSGTVRVLYDATTNFQIAADEYYHVDSVLTNGGVAAGAAGAATNFTWSHVRAGGTVAAAFAADLAAQGSPHWWLADHYPGSNDFDALEQTDSDGDRMDAWAEYVAGTDPTNGMSLFECQATTVGVERLVLRWWGVADRLYTVHWADEVTGVQAWSNAPAGADLPGADAWQGYTNDVDGVANRRYFGLGVRLAE